MQLVSVQFVGRGKSVVRCRSCPMRSVNRIKVKVGACASSAVFMVVAFCVCVCPQTKCAAASSEFLLLCSVNFFWLILVVCKPRFLRLFTFQINFRKPFQYLKASTVIKKHLSFRTFAGGQTRARDKMQQWTNVWWRMTNSIRMQFTAIQKMDGREKTFQPDKSHRNQLGRCYFKTWHTAR